LPPGTLGERKTHRGDHRGSAFEVLVFGLDDLLRALQFHRTYGIATPWKTRLFQPVGTLSSW
jgi:hypothetical protein